MNAPRAVGFPGLPGEIASSNASTSRVGAMKPSAIAKIEPSTRRSAARCRRAASWTAPASLKVTATTHPARCKPRRTRKLAPRSRRSSKRMGRLAAIAAAGRTWKAPRVQAAYAWWFTGGCGAAGSSGGPAPARKSCAGSRPPALSTLRRHGSMSSAAVTGEGSVAPGCMRSKWPWRPRFATRAGPAILSLHL